MKHMWLVGILASVALVGSAAAQTQTTEVPTGEVALGAVTLPRAVTADGKPLAKGRYTVRLTAEVADPAAPGQSPSLERWAEFLQGGQVKGREVVSIVPQAEVKDLLPNPDGGKMNTGGTRVEMLKGNDYLRVWIARGGVHYLIHFPTS